MLRKPGVMIGEKFYEDIASVVMDVPEDEEICPRAGDFNRHVGYTEVNSVNGIRNEMRWIESIAKNVLGEMTNLLEDRKMRLSK